jgi:hypothetical protein
LQAIQRLGKNGCPMARLLLLALSALAIALAACGEDTEEKNDYVDALNAAQQRYADAAAGLGTDPEAYDRQIEQLTKSTDKLIAEVEELDPPDEVQEQHDAIVATLKEFNDTVKPVLDDLNSGDPAKEAEAVNSISAAATKLGVTFDQQIDSINQELQN